MSYILEALKKSDAERKRGTVPTLSDTPQTQNATPVTSGKPWPWIFAGGFVLVALIGISVLALMGHNDGTSAPQRQQEVKTKPHPKPKPITKVKTPVSIAAAATPVIAPASKPALEPTVKKHLGSKPSPRPPIRHILPELKNAAAYVNRAWGSMDQGLYAQAIDDLDRAVKLEPTFADAWFAHGWANEKNGDELAAIQDYSRTIETKPDHALALFSRGFLYLYGNNPRAAVMDFVRTQGVATNDSLRLYSRLWLYLSRARAGQDARARLKEDATHESLAAWPGPLVLYFLKALDESGVVTAIENAPKAKLKERRATGYFFLGIAQLEAKKISRARAYFEKVLATGAVHFRQYDAARRELERLNQTAAQKGR